MENLRNKVYYEIQGLMIFLERCRSMTITLESSIIHILNTAEEYPILSNRPFHLDSEVKDYYRLNMMNVYNEYKDIILAVSNR